MQAASGWLLAGVIFAPLLPLPWLHTRRGRQLAAWAPAPALAAAALLPADTTLILNGLLLGSVLGLDAPVGVTFLALTAIVWLAAGVHAARWIEDSAHAARFWAFFLFAQSGNLMLCVTQDAVSFYAAFALMSFAAYGLVAHAGDDEARRAARVYLGMAVAGETLILVGLIVLAARGDAVAATPWLILGFGVKVGLPLLHVWLPLAHPVAPAPASAVLSGVMLKAGMLGWLRFLPLGEAALPGIGQALMLAGALAIGLGVVFGLMQSSAKVVLAYSSVSQMGTMTLAIGAGLVAPAAWLVLLPALLLYVGHHALVKSALFLGAGWINRFGARRRDWLFLALPAAALAGAPWTGGQLAKVLLTSALETPEWQVGWTLASLLFAGAFGSALLMARMFWCLHTAAPPKTGAGMPGSLCLWMMAAAFLPMGLAQEASWRGLSELWGKAIIPVVLALAVAVAAIRFGGRLPAVPPGDVLNVFEDRCRHGCSRVNARFAALALLARAWFERKQKLRWPQLRDWRRAWGVWLALLLLLAAGVVRIMG